MDNGYTPKDPTGEYDLATASAVCTLFEAIACKFGYHVALTGGCLYGDGGRKDIDIVFYRIRQVNSPDTNGMLERMNTQLQVDLVKDYGFVKKLLFNGIPIDAMFPEWCYGDYDAMSHFREQDVLDMEKQKRDEEKAND